MPPADKKPGDESQVQASVSSAGAEQAAATASDAVASAAAADAAPAADLAAGAPEIPKGVAVMRHPEDDKASASYRGNSYEPNEKGFIVVPLDAVSELASHGFVMVKEG